MATAKKTKDLIASIKTQQQSKPKAIAVKKPQPVAVETKQPAPVETEVKKRAYVKKEVKPVERKKDPSEPHNKCF
jgi:hypothetical protein